MFTFVGLVFKWERQICAREIAIAGKEFTIAVTTVHVAVVGCFHFVLCRRVYLVCNLLAVVIIIIDDTVVEREL